MFKRILPFIIVVLIAAPVAIVFWLSGDREMDVYRSSAIEMVPDEPVLILECKSSQELIRSLVHAEPVFNAFQKMVELQPLTQGLANLDSLLNLDSDLADRFKNTPLLLSVHATGKSSYEAIFMLEAGSSNHTRFLEKIFSIAGYGECTWSSLDYDREKIEVATIGDGVSSHQVFVYGSKKYLVISRSQILIENSIRIGKTENPLLQDSELSRLMNSAGIQTQASIFVNARTIPAWWSKWMSEGLAPKMAGYQQYGGWVELDLLLRDNAILLTGVGSGDITDPSFLEIFRDQEPQPVDVARMIPGSASGYLHYGIQHPETYVAALARYMDANAMGKAREKAILEAKNLVDEDPSDVFIDLIANDLILTWLSSNDGKPEKPVVLIGTQSRNQTFTRLSDWMDLKAASEKKDVGSYRSLYKIDEEKSYAIYQMPVNRLPFILGGGPFSEVDGRYFSFIGNYLVMADQVRTLEDVIYHFELNKMLESDPLYTSATNLINSRSSFSLFLIPSRWQNNLIEALKKPLSGLITGNETFLQHVGVFGMQFHHRNDYYHNLFIQAASIDTDRPQTVWESKLDDKVSIKPVFTLNHNTQAREIMVQDHSNNLYLINTAGRVLWKIPVGEQVKSEIFQVDIYRNDKLQYLFSTENQIHLIDRNGNYVEKYPVRLRAPATNGLGLFDYDRNRDYRMLIACSDRKTYLYDIKGNLMKGWDFNETEGVVSQPAQHFRSDNKDYIVFHDEMRIYIVDRTGSVRVQQESQFPVSQNNLVTFDPNPRGQSSRFVMTDADGQVFFIYLNGKIESKTIRKFEPGHFFVTTDLNRDGFYDFVFVENNRLEVYKHDGTLIFEHKFNDQVSFIPNIYQFTASSKKIGVVLAAKNDIFLFNDDGSLYKGFPLRGCTPFTIGFLESGATNFNLIVGSTDQFLYNYRVK